MTSRPMRFVQVTTFYPPYNFGGDGLYVYRLSHALAARGHHVDVVHCVDSYRYFVREEPAVRLPDHPNVTVHPLRSRLGWLSPVLSHQTGQPFLKRAAIERLLERPADVIHFHNVSLLGPGVLGIGNGAGQLLKVYTTHEHWLVCPTHVLWKFDREPCDRPTCLRCLASTRRPPQLWRYTNLLSRAAEHIDLFLSPSDFTARMHAERGFDRPLSHLAPFAARSDQDWQHPDPPPHPRPYFLFVGRLEPVKGLSTLLRIWDRVEGADLLVIGDGGERPAALAAAARNPRIVVLGPLAPHELGRYYVHARAVLVPSVTYEVAPTVVLEAFARKTPVIARDLGGTSEFVRGAGGGLLFKNDDELLEAIGELAGDARRRDELGARGYEAFIARWTEDAHIAAYLDLLERAARGKFGAVPWQPARAGETVEA